MFLRDSECIGNITTYNVCAFYYSDCIKSYHSNVIANIER